jgi:hypothetical protein
LAELGINREGNYARKKYRVMLTAEEGQVLHDIINKGKHEAQIANGPRRRSLPMKGVSMRK